MSSYIYKRNKEGIHYLDLAKTWEKLMVAARIVAATQAKNPKDVLVSYSFDISSLFENFTIWKLSQKLWKQMTSLFKRERVLSSTIFYKKIRL